jgi:hypothetical protein
MGLSQASSLSLNDSDVLRAENKLLEGRMPGSSCSRVDAALLRLRVHYSSTCREAAESGRCLRELEGAGMGEPDMQIVQLRLLPLAGSLLASLRIDGSGGR